MYDIIFGILLGLLPFTLLGLLTLVQWARPKRAPMDGSNVINHIRLWWFVIKSPQKFCNLFYKKRYGAHGTDFEYVTAFPWLKGDEGDNVDGAI